MGKGGGGGVAGKERIKQKLSKNIDTASNSLYLVFRLRLYSSLNKDPAIPA